MTPISSIRATDFYKQSTAKLSEVLLKVINHEGPIHREEAWRRVIQHWGMRTVGSRIRDILKGVEKFCVSNGRIEKRSNFYWNNDKRSLKIRNRDIDGYSKNIEYVPPEEIREAIIFVLTMDYSVPMDSLIAKSAKLLGFNRVGDDVYKLIRNSINWLKKNNIIDNQNGSLRVNHKQN